MKYPKTVQKLIDNKYVLYIVSFFVVANILGYASLGNTMAILLFFVFSGITYLFEKNMTVVLFVSIVLTSLFMVGKTAKEGLENQMSTTDATTPATTDATAIPDINQISQQLNSSLSGLASVAAGNATPAAPVKKDEKAATPAITLPATSPTGGDVVFPTDATHETTTETTEEPTGTTQTNSESMSNYKRGNRNRIDYAATIEEAYGDLSKILGSDGIKGLTDDTHRLMKQQMQLAEAMKSMTPLVQQAQTMLQGIDVKSLGSLAGLAKQFTNQ